MRILILGVASCFAGLVIANNVESDFSIASIVPDILTEAPKTKIEVKYGNKEVNFGNEFTPTETQQIPEIHYKHEGGVLYTLILTDPDVPTKGYTREFRHWIVGNIPEENIAKGEILAEYVGPAPPQKTGKHRYVFLLYKQNQGAITFDERRLGRRDGLGRKRFSLKRFVDKYNLESPLAGNFFTAKYDDNVPEYQRLMGFNL